MNPPTAATATALTPMHLRDGRWYKREDLHTLGPVNGAKLRACQHLIGTAAQAGATEVISAASVLSPQNAMAAVVAASYGLPCTIIIGAPERTATRHRSVRIATEHGATLRHVPVGYNPYLQARARELAAERPGAYHLQYGITTPADAGHREIAAFYAVGAAQVTNLPADLRTLVVPFGSGNTACGVLYGLATQPHAATRLERVVLVGIGPDRRPWLREKLAGLGCGEMLARCEHVDLHGSGYATYGTRMPGQAGGITLHPTYEGKVARWMDQHQPDYWTARDGTTCLWIVGGPL